MTSIDDIIKRVRRGVRKTKKIIQAHKREVEKAFNAAGLNRILKIKTSQSRVSSDEFLSSAFALELTKIEKRFSKVVENPRRIPRQIVRLYVQDAKNVIVFYSQYKLKRTYEYDKGRYAKRLGLSSGGRAFELTGNYYSLVLKGVRSVKGGVVNIPSVFNVGYDFNLDHPGNVSRIELERKKTKKAYLGAIGKKLQDIGYLDGASLSNEQPIFGLSPEGVDRIADETVKYFESYYGD